MNRIRETAPSQPEVARSKGRAAFNLVFVASKHKLNLNGRIQAELLEREGVRSHFKRSDLRVRLGLQKLASPGPT